MKALSSAAVAGPQDRQRSFFGFIQKHWMWVAVLCLLILVIPLFTPAAYFLWGVPSTRDFFAQKLGLSESISYVLAIPFMFVYVLALPYAMRWMFFAQRDPKSLSISLGAILFVFASKPFLFFALSSPFSSKGDAQWCSSERGREIVLLERGEEGCGIDPMTGLMTYEVTPSKMDEMRRKERPANRITLDGTEIQFFDNASGKALVWYDRSSDGVYQIFDGDGSSPFSGRPLKPVTSSVVSEINQQIEKSRRYRAVSGEPVRAEPSPIEVPNEAVRSTPRPTAATIPASRASSSSVARVSPTRAADKAVFVNEAAGNAPSAAATASPQTLRIETPLEGQ